MSPSTNDQPAPDTTTIEMQVGPDFHTTTLSNGLEVVVVPDHRIPLVNVGMAVRTGATSETPETNGLAHLYEHMFFTANRAYPSGSDFEDRERELGIVSNAFTSEEAVVYYFSLPGDNLNEGVGFMSEAMRHPLFKEDELKQERKVVLDEFNTRTSRPSRRLYRSVDKALFYKYPWRRSTLGEKDVISSATREDMMKFKDQYYHPENSVLLVVGDTSVEDAIASARNHFSDWSRTSKTTKDDEKSPHPPLESSKGVAVKADIQYASLLTKQHGPSVADSPDATYAADIWGKMLALSSSRFQNNLVDNGPYRSASMSYYTQKHGATIQFQGSFSPGEEKTAMDRFHREVQKFDRPGYFTKEQLRAAKNELIVERTFNVENGRDFLQSLGFWWSVAGLDYYGSYLKNLRSVTLDDVRQFCRTHVQEQPRVYGLLAPDNQKDLTSDTVLDLANSSRSSVKLDQTSFSSNDTSQSDTVNELVNVSYNTPENDGTDYFELSNGIPVIHRRVKENDVLSVQLFMDGGTMNYTNQPAGIEQFLLRTMLRGSEHYPLKRYQRITDREGISISSDSNYDFSRLSAGSLVEDLPLTLHLLEDLLKNPLLEKDQVEWVRKQLLTNVKKRRSNPRQQIWHVTNDVFFRNHPYQNTPEGTLESLKNIDREQLTSYYDRFVKSGRMLVTVVGRIPTSKLKQQLEQTIGTLPETAYEQPEVPPFQPPSDQPLNVVEQQGLSTAFIASKYPLPSLTSPEYPALKLGLKVLSDRIFEETRTKRGLTYGAYAGLPFFRQNWGYLFITTPRPNLAMSLIYQEIHKAKQNKIDPEELNRTANVLYTRQLINRQTAASIGSQLGRLELVGNGWDTFGDMLETIRSLSPDRVQSVLNKHLKNYAFGVIQGKDMKNKIDQTRLLHPEQARNALEKMTEEPKNAPAPEEK